MAVAALALVAVDGRRQAVAWLTALAVVAAAAGVVIGDARVAAIDRSAYAGAPGRHVTIRGFVAGVPRPLDGHLLVPIETADGLLAVQAPEPERELQVGGEVRAKGSVRAPEPWLRSRLEIAGIQRVVAAPSIESSSRRRGGLAGLVDGLRDRAEAALERGVPAPEAALARGFVLGQDDRIDPATVDDFRKSGLAHLLAVSGQNVLLLALLAFPVLAVLGLLLRSRLAVVIGLILLYVPITGAGPSIQRAAVMGVAGIVAVLAGRPSHRWYALLLAAAVTLAVNPRAAGDIGWQLSFAAVIGILLWARPIAGIVLRRGRGRPSPLRRGLAEGIGVTVAATLATAPISALHFETVSLASLPANLLALPAVAPVMWLGMLSAALGQLSWIPLEPLNWLCSLLVAYIAQVAHWLAAPSWASVPVTAPSPAAIGLITVAMLTCGALATRALGRRYTLHRRRPLRALIPATCVAVATLTVALLIPLGPSRDPAAGASGLTVTILDVGQGDAILLDPEPGDPVLVDTGPPGTDLSAKLADRGVERLAAIVVTHDQSDHAGGLAAVLDRIGTEHVVTAESVASGASLRSGPLKLEVLWPPRGGDSDSAADPNDRSIVLLARWRRFDALLTGDGEAEAIPLDPGPLDLLKLAHHGSEDAGLPALLERTDPALAVISVGAGNPYGHPHPSTIAALADEHVPVMRTDRDGDVEISVTAQGLAVTG